jgi:hypothetical protein
MTSRKEKTAMFTNHRPVLCGLALIALGLFPGCVGIYDNTGRFMNPPKEGLTEAELITTYGAPDFTNAVEGGAKMYVYKVRDVKYIILVGVYEGYDLVVTVVGGKVKETKQLPRAKSMTLFQPIPWAVAD